MDDHTEDFIKALEMYYEKDYNEAQRLALKKNLGSPPYQYLRDLYDEIVKVHTSQFGKLPDVAVIRKIRMTLDPVEGTTYHNYLLPDPDDVSADYNDEVRKIVDASLEAREEELNKLERDRVRAKRKRGEATRHERWWLHTIEDLDGQWKPMPEDFE